MSYKKRILCLDNGYGMIQSMAKTLISGGYEVQVANSTDEALNCYKRNSFDLVILCLSVPEVEDIEFLVNIRHINPEQKVMVITTLPPNLPLWKIHHYRTEVGIVDMGLSSFFIRQFSLEKSMSRIFDLYDSSPNNDGLKDNRSGIHYDFFDELIFLYAVKGEDSNGQNNTARSFEVPDLDGEFEFLEIQPCNSYRDNLY